MKVENWEGLPAGMEVRTEVKKGYLNVIIEGKFQTPEAQKIGTRIFDFCHQIHMQKVLIDARKIEGPISLVTKIEFADSMVAKQMEYIVKGSARLKIAHVVAEGMAEPAKFGETLAAIRGMSIFVTTSMDDALQWLGVDKEA
jgi:hypothetical protein